MKNKTYYTHMQIFAGIHAKYIGGEVACRECRKTLQLSVQLLSLK